MYQLDKLERDPKPSAITRRTWLGVTASAALAMPIAGSITAVTAVAQDAKTARKITRGAPQIFVDLQHVAGMDNMHQVFHPATKPDANPVLKGEKPWEAFAYSPTAGFIYDEEDRIFKCWYMGLLGDVAGPEHSYGKHVLCYATSKDGVEWDRPSLGLHAYEGSKDTNIVIPETYHEGLDHWESVEKDTFTDDDTKRYKGFGWSSKTHGLHTMWSADGLHWEHSTDHAVPGGDAQSMMIDTMQQRYVALVRGGAPTGVHVSKDFVNWSERDNGALNWYGPGSCYNQVGFNYGDTYLGLMSWYQTHLDHLMDTRLLTSRDGLHYTPAGDDCLTRPAIIPMAEQYGEWDRFQTRMTGAAPVMYKDKVYIYYRGFNTSHDKKNFPKDNWFAGALGLATLRLDGFASLGARFDGGTVTTTPFVCPGGSLTINVVSNHQGLVTAEVLNQAGNVIDHYAANQCVPIEADDVRALVKWKSREHLDEIKGQPIALRFHLRNARFYAYRIG